VSGSVAMIAPAHSVCAALRVMVRVVMLLVLWVAIRCRVL
jgi:hypothetical protein